MTDRVSDGAWKPLVQTMGVWYLAWTGITLAVWAGGRFWAPDGMAGRIAAEASVVFHVLLAAAFLPRWLIAGPEDLSRRPALPWSLMIPPILIGIGIVGYQRTAGSSPVWLQAVSGANLLWAAFLAGLIISRSVNRPSEILILCLVASLADLISVSGGPTRQIAGVTAAYYTGGMKGAAPLADAILVKIPAPGRSAFMPVFGMADWIIAAFLCAAAGKFHMKDNLAGPPLADMIRRKRPAVYLPPAVIGLLAAVGLARLTGVHLPALPFVVGFFLIHGILIHPGAWRFASADFRNLGAAAVLLAVLWAFFRFVYG